MGGAKMSKATDDGIHMLGYALMLVFQGAAWFVVGVIIGWMVWG